MQPTPFDFKSCERCDCYRITKPVHIDGDRYEFCDRCAAIVAYQRTEEGQGA